jgi:predicted DNA-binding transcriptional regulator YafY
MRHDKASQVLLLARTLASSAEGMTIDEMARELGVARRTAERMRDAVAALFPQMEIVEEPPFRRFRIPGGLDGLYQAPTADELAALNRAAESFSAGGNRASAAALRSLERKVLAATKAGARRRLAPDLEALVQAEAIAVQAGPRPFEDEAVLNVIRESLLANRMLRFRYQGGRTPGAHREVTPCGLLFARSNYLGRGGGGGRAPQLAAGPDRRARRAPAPGPSAARLRPPGLCGPELRHLSRRGGGRGPALPPEAAEGARRWRFHPEQTVEQQEDGAVLVRFRATGMRELAWHLFTWGPTVEILAPDRLKEVLVAELGAALAAHTT